MYIQYIQVIYSAAPWNKLRQANYKMTEIKIRPTLERAVV